jgi:ParB-like chromosome segregation protein Spo0J
VADEARTEHGEGIDVEDAVQAVADAIDQIDLTIHPSADLFPMLPADELQELAESIKRHGLREKIVVDTNGQVIDGRNRYAALTLAGIRLKAEHVTILDFDKTGYSPNEYIVMANLERRNLTRDQRRELAGKLAVHLEDAQAEKPKEAKVDTTQKAADLAGVSRRTAADAKQKALVDMGLRPAPTPQNESKKPGPKAKDKPTDRPPKIVAKIKAAFGDLRATKEKWPGNKKEDVVRLAWDILNTFPDVAYSIGPPAHIAGLFGFPEDRSRKPGEMYPPNFTPVPPGGNGAEKKDEAE